MSRWTGVRALGAAETYLLILASYAHDLGITELFRGGLLYIGRMSLDRYDRTLTYVRVGGSDLGEVLIAEGLVRP